MSELTENFVRAYSREFDFYQELAHIAAGTCDRLLSRNGIRGIVTYRAKRVDRLRDKLRKREAERTKARVKPYQSFDDIRNDVVDLAGVRIALYFPGDRDRVTTLLESEFDSRLTKRFPEEGRKRPQENSFPGYHATHLRVLMRAEGEGTLEARYLDTLVEVQLASVLMHAWAEVEHDLSYKPATGSLSEDETAILDQLNGLVLVGESALQRLQRAVEHRVKKGDSPFSNRYELAAFLYDAWRKLSETGATDPSLGDVGALLWLIDAAAVATPTKLEPYLEELDRDTERRPLADQIADQILAVRPHLTEGFRAQRDAPDTALAAASAPAPSEDAALQEFLNDWLVIERFGRLLQAQRTGGRRPLTLGMRDFSALLPNEPTLAHRLRWISDLRNKVVHGRRAGYRAALEEARQEIADIIGLLKESGDPVISEAIQRALEGQDAEIAQPTKIHPKDRRRE
jgi:ppGpp synthetase/RelA/SpoT-type nucleotidyltranferase